MNSPTALRANRRNFYVHVESATVRDRRLSYRALGLLTYILDQSEEWKVRSEQLCKGEGREGREAVRKTLHELAAHGYYRLERRQFRHTGIAMGAAVSEFPVEQWAADYKTFGESLTIPVVEQPDGSFLVRYPDGSLGSDGFEPDLGGDPEAKPDAQAEEEPEPEMEETAPQAKAAPTAKRAAQKPTAAAVKRAETNTAKAAEKKALDDDAEEVAAWWWKLAEEHFGKYVGQKGGYVAMRRQVRNALAKNYTKQECAKALQHARKHWPSAQQWQEALGVVTNHIAPRTGSRPTPYSDAATWGNTMNTTVPGSETTPPDDTDDAVFGVLPA
ncbi:hypothetical protein [Streptomyces subrutilus]|uniref:Helix-turn-helix domain-containing protein n=1 Tax=Streptomyces subrutilus TaxID=36818 RepID=A0A1E5NXZ2_9ACTN|nr:hypothetical protein [Streptomyces subrutilus]OEJ21007.1 hypothetical protein BGK67_34490 [Streptomyces subrutilus]